MKKRHLPYPHTLFAALLLPAMLLQAGCASQRPLNTLDNQPSVTYTVDGLGMVQTRNQFGIGPWSAEEIRWSWTGRIVEGERRPDAEKVKAFSRNFEFRMMEDGQEVWEVACRHETNLQPFDEALTGVRSGRRAYLHCRMEAADGSGRVATLHLVNRADRPMSGRIGFEQAMFEVSGMQVNNFPGVRTRTAGYHFYNGSEVLLSVEKMRDGGVRIHLPASGDHGKLFSASAMALLLQDEILARK